MLKNFLGNSALYVLASMLNRGIAFLLLPVYTHYLTPADYGIIAVCTATYSALIPLVSLNLQSAVNLFYFKLNQAEYKKLLGTIWLWFLIVPIILAVILELLGTELLSGIFSGVPWNPYLRLAVMIGLTSVTIELPSALFYAEQKAAKYALLTISSFLTTTLFLLYFIVVRQTGPLGSLHGQFIASAIITCVSHYIVFRRFDSIREVTFNTKHFKEALFLAVPTIPYVICLWTINLSDRWVLDKFVDSSEIGIYNLAYTLGMIVSTIGLALGTAFAPIYYGQYKEAAFRERLPKLLSLYLMIVMLTALAVSVLAPEMLKVMASSAYFGAWRYVPFVAGAYWLYSGFYLLSLNIIQNEKQTKWIIVLTAPAAAINIGLNWLLVPRWGIWVAALNTTVAFGLMAATAYCFAGRFDKLPYRFFDILQMIVISIVVYAISIEFLSVSSLFLALLGKTFLLGGAAILMLLVCGFRFKELSLIKDNLYRKSEA